MDARKNDWNKLGRGRPTVAAIQDAEVRRAFETNQQNIEYLMMKVRDIRKLPKELEDLYPLTDVSKTVLDRDKNKKLTKRPQVVLTVASWIKPASASVEGLVNPMGYAASYYFQYGKDLGFGSETSTGSAGAGEIAIDVSATITGLEAGEKYYIQLVAWNEAGYAYSNILSITTGAMPEVAITGAEEITFNSATLTGTVDPNELATTYQFTYGKTMKCESSSSSGSAGDGADPVVVTAGLTGLDYQTTYYYRLTGTNAAGTAVSTRGMFRTLRPNTPTVLILGDTFRTDRSTVLNGTATPNGYDTTCHFIYGTGFNEDGSLNYSFSTPSVGVGAGADPVSVSAAIAPLTAGAIYNAKLIGTNSQGTATSGNLIIVVPSAEATLSGDLAFASFIAGETGSEVKSLGVANSGDTGSTLDWDGAITNDAGLNGKLAADVASGHVAAGDTDAVLVTLTKDSVAAGVYAGLWTVTPQAGIDAKTLPLSLTVLANYGVTYSIYGLKEWVYHSGKVVPPWGPSGSTQSKVGNIARFTGAQTDVYKPLWASTDGGGGFLFGYGIIAGKAVAGGAWTMQWTMPILYTPGETSRATSGALSFDGNGRISGSYQPSYTTVTPVWDGQTNWLYKYKYTITVAPT